MLREHGPAKWVNLDLPSNLKARARKAEIKPPDPGEQRSDRHTTTRSAVTAEHREHEQHDGEADENEQQVLDLIGRHPATSDPSLTVGGGYG
jgi:hypothetical protein